MVALTFDDGPDPQWTPAVLDALAAAGARATFFVLGERVRAHPGLVRRTLAEGHVVEVHGDEHLSHPDAGEAAVRTDLTAALAALAQVGVEPRRWRIPWGRLAPFTPAVAAQAGLALTGWTVDTHDWRGDDAASMLAACAPALAPGTVVLAHDGLGPGALRTGCAETAALVGPLTTAIRAAGLSPVPLDAAWRHAVPPGNPELAPFPPGG
jgi:peptidoglycan/xylan/chitin deacetylase (PgdA/CDA1 family)